MTGLGFIIKPVIYNYRGDDKNANVVSRQRDIYDYKVNTQDIVNANFYS